MQNNAKGIPTDLDVGIRGTCYGEILTQQLGSISRLDHFLVTARTISGVFWLPFGGAIDLELFISVIFGGSDHNMGHP